MKRSGLFRMPYDEDPMVPLYHAVQSRERKNRKPQMW